MKSLSQIIGVMVLLCSCSEKEELPFPNDWQTELIGTGYIYENPDSLNLPFYYFPHQEDRPESLKERDRSYPEVNGDTIMIPNTLLHYLYKSRENERNTISQDSSYFVIDRFDKQYKFTKILGHRRIPKVLYFRKYSNQYPEKFDYQVIDGMDNEGSYVIEITGKDSIKVWLKGGPYQPYLYEQYKKSDIDDLFIGSYLNLICDTRYDTVTFQGTVFCGVILDELLVYNDSVFDYSTYFRRLPDSGILLNYFRSKIEQEVDILNEFDFDLAPTFEPRKFDTMPIAVENWEILAPPELN